MERSALHQSCQDHCRWQSDHQCYAWTAFPTADLKILNETYILIQVADGIVDSGGNYEWFITADEFFFSITFR